LATGFTPSGQEVALAILTVGMRVEDGLGSVISLEGPLISVLATFVLQPPMSVHSIKIINENIFFINFTNPFERKNS